MSEYVFQLGIVIKFKGELFDDEVEMMGVSLVHCDTAELLNIYELRKI